VALTPQDNESFYREVDESLREQQLIDMWQRHGRTIVIAVVVVLAAVGAVLIWQGSQSRQAETQAEQLAAALDSVDANKVVKPAQLLPLESSRHDGYRAAARLLAADLALQRGDNKSAIAGFGAVATDASFAQPYRELALLRQTAVEFDQLPPATIIARMKPLAVAGGAWLGSAGEMLAAAYIREGKTAQAGSVFAMISRDEKVPASLRSRAEQMAGMLGSDAGPAPAAKE
jgi:hypothetical protein